jgi:hypothetical protein
MTLTTLARQAMAAYALHNMEECTFDLRNWARAAIKALFSPGLAWQEGPVYPH